MLYLWLKTFHIVGVVTWFAGLFYHGRLLVYHAEALSSPEPDRRILVAQYGRMESRLLRLIMTPAMGLTLLTAAGMLLTSTGRRYLTEPWMLAKLVLVALLIALHCWLRRIMLDLAATRGGWSAGRLRVLNEAPTVLLVLITILAVFKATLSWRGLGLTAALLVVALWAGIRGYARYRNREGARPPRPGPEKT